MEQIFNKLVRDKIPEKIEKNGEVAVTRTLTQEEYLQELNKKLLEESHEVINAINSAQTIEELADVLEVLESIAELNGYTLDDIIQTAKTKKEKRGGFTKRLFLEKTYSKEK